MLLSLEPELKTNLKGLLQFTCPVLGINHSGVFVCAWHAHIQRRKLTNTLISRCVQRAPCRRLAAYLFRFRVVLAECLLKAKPFTPLPPMLLLLGCFFIQIRIIILLVLTCVLHSCVLSRKVGFVSQQARQNEMLLLKKIYFFNSMEIFIGLSVK